MKTRYGNRGGSAASAVVRDAVAEHAEKGKREKGAPVTDGKRQRIEKEVRASARVPSRAKDRVCSTLRKL